MIAVNVPKNTLRNRAEAVGELARRHLLDFAHFVFPQCDPAGRAFEVNWHHKLLARHLDRWARGEIKRLLIFMPPRHSKTEMCSVQLPAKLLGIYPTMQVMAASYGASLAKVNKQHVERVMATQRYQSLFTGTQPAASFAEGMAFKTTRGGLYLCAGVGGALTGFGFDRGIIDDPIKNREEAESQAYRDTTWQWYTSTFHTRRADNDAGELLMVTRWHDDDIAGRILRNMAESADADRWEVLCLPAIYDEALQHIHPEDPRSNGEALWPGLFDEAALAATKGTIGSYDWWALYQQQPQPPGGSKIKRSWFKIVDKAPEGLRWFRYWDLAVSAKTSANHTASPAGALHNGDLYLRDMVRGQWEWPETRTNICLQAKAEPGVMVGIEEAGQQKGFIDDLLHLPELGATSLRGIKSDKDKLTRALPWIARAEAGHVYLVRGGWISAFLDEGERFTGHNDKADDQIDGVSGVYRMACDFQTDLAIVDLDELPKDERTAEEQEAATEAHLEDEGWM